MRSSPRAFVIGHPIAHSRSPMLHSHWLRTLGLAGTYDKVDVAPADLGTFIGGFRQQGFVGGNITLPHKTVAMSFVDRVDAAAKAIGAINTIWIEGGELVATNTDAYGFLSNLDERAPGWDGDARRGLILGAGGAARAAVHGLLERGLAVDIANRTASHGEELARHFGPRVRAHDLHAVGPLLAEADLLVNTTALGMSGKPPLDLDLAPLKRGATVCDMVYVPLETNLIETARRRGHPVVDGLGMLLHQAVPGFARWFGVTPWVTAELRAVIEADIRGS